MNFFALVGVSAVFLAGVVLARTLRVKRKLVCPETGTVEDVGVVDRFLGEDRPRRVVSCSRFPRRRGVDCDQDCIREEHLRAG